MAQKSLTIHLIAQIVVEELKQNAPLLHTDAYLIFINHYSKCDENECVANKCIIRQLTDAM